jgi:uncharacterized integral membrane protein
MTQPIQSSDNRAPQESEARESRVGFGAILSLIGAGLLLAFIVQNSTSVDLDFLFWTFTWPLWLLIVVAALLGAAVWFGLGVIRRHRRRVSRRENRRS